MKQCTRCKQVKPLTEFWRDRSKSDGHRSQCTECRKRYKQSHAVQIREQQRSWHQRNPHYARNWFKARPGYNAAERRKEQKRAATRKWRENNKESHAILVKQWREANPDKVIQWDRDRRARKAQAEGIFTDEQFQELCRHWNNRCLRCDETSKLTVDHVIPLSRGGSNDISNIQPLCGSCNSRKGTRIIDYR